MVGLMTESELVTILEGMGYQAFRDPRPVAWDQNYYSDANWECCSMRGLCSWTIS